MSPAGAAPDRLRRARRAGAACLAALVLLTSCGGGDEAEQAPNPTPQEVGSDPTEQPPDVGEADPEAVPAVPGQSEGVGPDPEPQDG